MAQTWFVNMFVNLNTNINNKLGVFEIWTGTKKLSTFDEVVQYLQKKDHG